MNPPRSSVVAAAVSLAAEEEGPSGHPPLSPPPEATLDDEERAALVGELLAGIRFLYPKCGPTMRRRLAAAIPLRPHFPRSGMSLYSPQQYDRVQYLLRDVYFLCLEDRRALENRLTGCDAECFSSWPNASSASVAPVPDDGVGGGAAAPAPRESTEGGKRVRFSVVGGGLDDDDEAARFFPERDDDDDHETFSAVLLA